MEWLALAAKLRVLVLAAGLGAGALVATGCDVPDEDTASVEGEVTTDPGEDTTIRDEAAPPPVPRSTSQGATCRNHGDCRNGTNFCCNHRCRRNFPGLRCVERGGGAFE
jgi:hypothetical protein